MVALVFPANSTPGARPGEGAGRIVNAYAAADGDAVAYAPMPGLVPFATVAAGPRGMLPVSNTLYVVAGSGFYSVQSSGVATFLGSVPGSGLVTMARNNKIVPDIVMVIEGEGARYSNGTNLLSYPDGDIGVPNSVTFLDGYFVTTSGDGTIAASELNSTAFNSLSVAQAESNPDGLLRGIRKDRQFIALGSYSTEFWSNVGTAPFPLARDEVRDVGLLSRFAIAGSDDGWDGPLFMVASDRTVRRWDGYTATRVSTREVERSIETTTDVTQIFACAYIFGGNPVFSLTGPNWTWEHHVASGRWYERESYGLETWRGRTTARCFGRWMVGDLMSDAVLYISETARQEADDPLIWSVEGIGPARARLGDMRLHFSTGQGRAEATSSTEIEPTVMVDWSFDGGASYGTKLQRSLGKQGQYRRKVQVANLGTARELPVRVRVTVSDPVRASFYGGEITNAVGLR